jgi:hypothetical protein
MNLTYPLKVPVVKIWSLQWHSWEVVEPLGGGAKWELFRSLRRRGRERVTLKGRVETSLSFFFFFSFLL